MILLHDVVPTPYDSLQAAAGLRVLPIKNTTSDSSLMFREPINALLLRSTPLDTLPTGSAGYTSSPSSSPFKLKLVLMYFLPRRLLAILRIFSRSFRRLIVYLALKVSWLLRKAFSPLNHTSRTLQSWDPSHSQLELGVAETGLLSPSTSAPITPIPSTSSRTSTNRVTRPAPGYLQAPSPSQTSHTPPIPQSTENARQPSQHSSVALTCRPAIPYQMKRYQRAIQIPTRAPKKGMKLGKQLLSRPEVSGWKSEVHPEGTLFYSQNAEGYVVLTDTDLTDLRNLNEIGSSIQLILEEAKKFLKPQNESLVLVVELAKEDSKRRDGAQECLYYFADHEEKLLYWVHDYEIVDMRSVLCGGVKSTEDSHIKYAVEAQYWMHCERFSNMVPMPLEYLVDLRETLIHASTDMILSDTSVSPFAADDLLKLLTVVTTIEDNVAKSRSYPRVTGHSKLYPHSIGAIARIMRLLTHSKFLNFHGQPGARLNADQAIYTKQLASEEGFSTPIFYVLNILLLTAPRKHIRTLRGIYVDRVTNASRWGGFIGGLKDEWNGYTVFSTVLLAVDISFLAVPGVTNGNFVTSQTATAIMIYISTILSLGTLVVSVLLADQIRRYGIESLNEGAHYMSRMTTSILGIEAMAVMYSLPYALLIWSMLAFGVALSTMVFSSVHKVGRAVVIIFFVFTLILATWPITCGRGRRAARGGGGYYTH
ncbi:hypothetical protein BDN67DRAFT_659100 [Paxillus ammoniavirescens]|nr:hypothetical protein BDN67DRAFT_659100 [Paxillus ammoniavirescens]